MINSETILAQLQISKENLISEVSLLLGKKQLAEYRMKTEYFEKNINKLLPNLIKPFKTQTATLKWKMTG